MVFRDEQTMNSRLEVVRAAQTTSAGYRLRLVLLLTLLGGMAVFLCRGPLIALSQSVLHREGSSHGVFVPFISAYFFWLKRREIKKAQPRFSLPLGGAVVVAGLLVLSISRGSTEIALPVLSFVVVASGLVIALFGISVFKEVSFPLLFLATMIPLPETLYARIAEWMQAATTTGSVWLTQALCIPIYRDGYTIQLPNASLFIAMSCSGIRYLLSYFVFSLAYAFLCKSSGKGRILVVLASFPTALMAGVLRLSSIYLAVYYVGPFMAGHRPHILLSWSVFLAVLVIAISGDQYLSAIRERRIRTRA